MKTVFDFPMISIPISQQFRDFALLFAREQPTVAHQKQVYLNTLAVQAVNSYLQLLEFATDLTASDSWNPYVRLTGDVGDLQLPGVGKVECRPIHGDIPPCLEVPAETSINRLAYIFVRIDKACLEAELIGFVSHIDVLEIQVQDLQPMEDLIEKLHINHLRQWLEGIYTKNWLSVEELSRQRTGELAFRSQRVRGFELDSPQKAWQVVEQLYPPQKWNQLLPADLHRQIQSIRSLDNQTDSSPEQHNSLLSQAIAHLLSDPNGDEEVRWTLAEILWTIAPHHPVVGARRIMDLGMQVAGFPVALMVAILPKHDDSVAVLVRVYPTGNQTYLSPGLTLTGLDGDGQEFLTVEASPQKDDYIQLKFIADFNEKFQVRVGMENYSITENFII